MLLVCRVSMEQQKVPEFIERHDLPSLGISNSGFNVDISESDDQDDVKRSVLAFLHSHAKAFAELKQMGGSAEIDIGLLVGSEQTFTNGISFSPSELEQFIEAGVELSISAYPCSEESSS